MGGTSFKAPRAPQLLPAEQAMHAMYQPRADPKLLGLTALTIGMAVIGTTGTTATRRALISIQKVFRKRGIAAHPDTSHWLELQADPHWP